MSFINQNNPETRGGRRSTLLRIMLVVIALLGLSGISEAQLAGKGGLNGRITDASGAVVPNATVEVIQPSTNARQSETTTGAGEYSFSLDPGKYIMKVSHAGLPLGDAGEHQCQRAADVFGGHSPADGRDDRECDGDGCSSDAGDFECDARRNGRAGAVLGASVDPGRRRSAPRDGLRAASAGREQPGDERQPYDERRCGEWRR